MWFRMAPVNVLRGVTRSTLIQMLGQLSDKQYSPRTVRWTCFLLLAKHHFCCSQSSSRFTSQHFAFHQHTFVHITMYIVIIWYIFNIVQRHQKQHIYWWFWPLLFLHFVVWSLFFSLTIILAVSILQLIIPSIDTITYIIISLLKSSTTPMIST